jgi:hypothetical protein
MKGTCALIAGGLLTILAPVILQAQVAAPRQPLRISVDVARFRGGDDNHSYIEVYYAFPRSSLTFTKDSTGFSAGLDITLRVFQKDSAVLADRWLVPQVLAEAVSDSPVLNLVGLAQVQLMQGEYLF